MNNKKEKEEVSLEYVNKKLNEMKKKIHLLEGQRKAQYEMWDMVKKQNADKIKHLKESLKHLYTEVGKQTEIQKNIKICDKILLNRENDEALECLDFKVIEARKKLDLLQHKINQKQQRIVELSAVQSSRTGNSSTSKWILPSANTVSSLENQIHQIEINIMEVEHLRKKYRNIKRQFADERVGFESTLKKLEQKIGQRENEISRVQSANEEAIHLRNKTYETLAEQEKKLSGARRTREMELEELRTKTEIYKLVLEKLERHIYPVKPTRQDSQSKTMETEEIEVKQQSKYLEKIFETLKEATGVIETDDVLRRFLSQKDTQMVLQKMKSFSEAEKKELIARKDEINAQLEANKFSGVKNNERSEEELQLIQTQIQTETENLESLRTGHGKIRQKIITIMERVHQFCLQMKHFDSANVPEKCPSIEKYEWLLRLFRTKVESALRHDKAAAEHKEKTKTNDLWSVLPYSDDSKISEMEDDEEDEEIPTRNGLKREAQLIYETRNRRKGYRLTLGKH